MLLSVYGVRSGEVHRLRLDDIDWLGNRIRFIRSKSGRHEEAPLVARVAVPLDLSDEAAARLIDFLLAIAHQMENHYSEQLYRYHNAIDERQPDLWSDTDPPF